MNHTKVSIQYQPLMVNNLTTNIRAPDFLREESGVQNLWGKKIRCTNPVSQKFASNIL